MNYKRIYLNIIKKALLENRIKNNGIYYEKHHILPKSMFPLWSKKKTNLVLLTAREHYICHLMLSKIYGDKMVYALWRLINNKQQKYIIKGSRDYQRLKEQFAEINRKTKSVKGFKHSDISRQHMSEARIGMKFSKEHKESLSRAAKRRFENPEELLKHSKRSIGRKSHTIPHTVETKIKICKAIEGLKWWTNGINCIYSRECPDGYKSGRIMKNMKNFRKSIRKQVKCIETTEAWLSLEDFAKEKEISIGYASKILKKGIYKNQHYKFII
jgi:hypothetical protein